MHHWKMFLSVHIVLVHSATSVPDNRHDKYYHMRTTYVQYLQSEYFPEFCPVLTGKHSGQVQRLFFFEKVTFTLLLFSHNHFLGACFMAVSS